MTSPTLHLDPRQIADPFRERPRPTLRRRFRVLGAGIEFSSDSEALLALADAAYAGLPEQTLTDMALQIELRIAECQTRFDWEPPAARMFGGAGLLGAAVDADNLALVDPAGHRAVVQISRAMLAHPYHARYELIEFAVFMLACRSQGLLALHAGCVGFGDVGALLIGASGAGKSTLALQAMLQGLDFQSEDASFVEPSGLRAAGVANFLHLRFDAPAWIDDAPLRERVLSSPVIRRRSGVGKYELDLRGGWARLAAEPPRIDHVVFAASEPGLAGKLLQPLGMDETLTQLQRSQAYAVGQPGWGDFAGACGRLHGWVLKRGAHPRDGAAALRELLMN